MTLRRTLWLQAALMAATFAADLPVREVILYKHGVGYFERAGELKSGETARLDFKAGDMNDVLKSLTITGGKIAGVRYDASETLEKRLEDFPFAVEGESSLAKFLDQMKGARLELKLGSEAVEGVIVSARLTVSPDKTASRETVLLLMDSGDIRSFDLGAASSVKLTDPKLQGLLKDYLTVLSQARSKDRRSIYIDSTGAAVRELVARYMTPAAVWKSSYRLMFSTEAQPTLEGWAIVDNTSGDDWTGVHLSVVSGKPISFITQLYEPRYVQRPHAELAENNAVAPVVFAGAMGGANDRFARAKAAPAPQVEVEAQSALLAPGSGGGYGGGSVRMPQPSSMASTAEGHEEGELFEYSFAGPVTVKKGESAMLPFLQQKVTTRKLLIYSDGFGLHAMDAAEITNSTGKTLDGGPITVYDSGAYAGEALVETLKAGDKRLISYGVDLGTRVTTAWDSSRDTTREVHIRRGVMTTRIAVEETKTYTIKNVDAKPKTLVIEHPERPGYKLLDRQPTEKTADAYRFEVKLPASGTETFPVREERVYDQTMSLTNMTPDILAAYLQNKSLSAAGRQTLQQIADKKRQIADNNAALTRGEAEMRDLTQDETRLRDNLASLRQVSGQQDQVQIYAKQLAAAESKIAALRDTQSQLRRTKTTLESDLNSIMERADF